VTPAGGGVLRVGDRVLFDQVEYTVVGLTGTAVRLHAPLRTDTVVLLPFLLAAEGFHLLDDPPGAELAAKLAPLGLLETLPPAAVAAAREWERHIVEVETGVPAGVEAGTAPRAGYDPQTTSLAEREQAKAAELSAVGRVVGVRTLQRLRARYRDQGLLGLVDQRALRRARPTGNADPRLVAAIQRAIAAETEVSTGTKTRLRRRVEASLVADYGPGEVSMPSTATFYRLVDALAAGRHTFGAATTRRSLANRPAGAFTPTFAARPGEQVQIDTTPLDVMVVFDDGVVGRPELTKVVDVATRTICAAVLRPEDTRAVDAALLLARMLVPEPLRPGWSQALAASASRLPHDRLVSIDARFELAAAKPVIVPETIVIDHGAAFISEVFTRACQTLGISVQPAHPGTPTDKGTVERTFESINTLFCQHVAGYTGRDVTRRGANVEAEAVWSLPELAELLDEWIVAGWQSRPHEGLCHPQIPGRDLSPNDMYAVLVAAAGYLPMTLAAEDYIELLPACWRTVNDYGVRIDNRIYDCDELGRYRRQPSGVIARRGQWEVHYDPYDIARIWVRNHHHGGWITVPWTYLPLVGQPLTDTMWRQARKLLLERGDPGNDQTAIGRVLDELLARAQAGPGPERRQLARTSTAAAMPLRPVDPPAEPEDDDPEPDASHLKVVPFGVFDPFSEEEYR
jgi:transposase InsO family protein